MMHSNSPKIVNNEFWHAAEKKSVCLYIYEHVKSVYGERFNNKWKKNETLNTTEFIVFLIFFIDLSYELFI